MDKLLEVIDLIYKLKALPRTGWVRLGIKDPESVADHSFGVAMLAALLPIPDGLDRERAIRIALFHDFAESITGDIVWESEGKQDLKLREEKKKLEQGAIDWISERVSSEFGELSVEYLKQLSPESQWVRQLDKLDMGLQAKKYGGFVEFILSARKHIVDHDLKNILELYDP